MLVELAALTSPAAAEVGRDPGACAIVPLGSIEQHGPHLPISTDFVLGRFLAEAVAHGVREPVVVTPPLPGGLSDHHLAFPGTVTLSRELFGGLITAYVDALERIGIQRVGLVSGHGGNFAFIGELAGDDPRLTAYDDLLRFVDVMMDAGRAAGLDPPQTDFHAGVLETSLALHLFEPERIGAHADVEGYVAAEPGWLDRMSADGIHALSTTGVLGRTHGATVEAGRVIADALAGEVLGYFADAWALTRVA
jgi:creatinine amidohydrolase